jgi:serine O-acetyltransferase
MCAILHPINTPPIIHLPMPRMFIHVLIDFDWHIIETGVTMKKIIYLMKAALYECMPANVIQSIEMSSAFASAIKMAQDDLIAYSKKDPADTSSSYAAVLHYRLAHAIAHDHTAFNKKLAARYAALISQRGKLKSGADIHYRANIGARFVLDHGYNTVIGETTIIGSDSYILGSVVLGARH